MPEPDQKPYRSKQDYGTPADFLDAVKRRLGITSFSMDFAADYANCKAKAFWDDGHNSLSIRPETWRAAVGNGWGWLNPPFTTIGPWAERCVQTRELGGSVAFLVPAAVGSNWYRDFVHGKAFVLGLNGRLAFMPDKPTWLYPKDCILALYSPLYAPGFDVWTWKPTRARKVA